MTAGMKKGELLAPLSHFGTNVDLVGWHDCEAYAAVSSAACSRCVVSNWVFFTKALSGQHSSWNAVLLDQDVHDMHSAMVGQTLVSSILAFVIRVTLYGNMGMLEGRALQHGSNVFQLSFFLRSWCAGSCVEVNDGVDFADRS